MSRLKEGAAGFTHFTSRFLPIPLVAVALVAGLVSAPTGLSGSGVGGPAAPPSASTTAANLSAASHSNKRNYYGDTLQLQDASALSTAVTDDSVTVSVTGPSSGARGVPLTFTATANGGSGSYSYSWACDYNPSFSIFTPGSQTITCTYSTAGSHDVVAQARDTISGAVGLSPDYFVTITGLPAPLATYTVTGAAQTQTGTYEVDVGKTVTFTAVETRASSYLWDFGDSTAAAGRSVTKSWSTVGTRTVILVIVGDGSDTSGSSSASISINVIPGRFKAVIVPGAAHLDLGASVWGTDVTVSNPGSESLVITPNFVPYLNEAPDTLDLSRIPYDSRLSFQLAPGGSWSQVDVVKFLNGGNNKGTLILKYEGNVAPPVTARVYFASASDPLGASYGAAFPSYQVDQGEQIAPLGIDVSTDQILIGLRSNESYRFVVTLYNASSTRATFRLNAFDQVGVPVLIRDATGTFVASRDFTVGPYQQIQVRDSELGLTDPNKRYVLKASRVSSDGTLVALGTALDRKTSDLVLIADDTPSTAAGSGVISHYVAGVVHLDTSRAQWRTDLRIFNRASTARNLYFEYAFTRPGGNEQRAHVDSKAIGPGELLTFDDVVDSLLKPGDSSVDLSGSTAGVLRLFFAEDSESATKPLLLGLRNYDDPGDGSGTAGTQLGVYSAGQSTAIGQPLLVIPGPEDSSRFYSVIGIFALDDVLTTGRITAFGPDGMEIGHYGYALNQAGGAGHFGQIRLSDLTDFTNPGTPVTVRVSVTSGGRVGAYATLVDLKTNDLTFIQGRPPS